MAVRDCFCSGKGGLLCAVEFWSSSDRKQFDLSHHRAVLPACDPFVKVFLSRLFFRRNEFRYTTTFIRR